MMKLTVFTLSLGLFVILTIQPSNADTKDVYDAFAVFCTNFNLDEMFDQCVFGGNKDQMEKKDRTARKNNKNVVDGCIEHILNTYGTTMVNDSRYNFQQKKGFVKSYRTSFPNIQNENQVPFLPTLKNRFNTGQID